jgi:hypothetical protein
MYFGIFQSDINSQWVAKRIPVSTYEIEEGGAFSLAGIFRSK